MAEWFPSNVRSKFVPDLSDAKMMIGSFIQFNSWNFLLVSAYTLFHKTDNYLFYGDARDESTDNVNKTG
jgi:hypothetical protein